MTPDCGSWSDSRFEKSHQLMDTAIPHWMILNVVWVIMGGRWCSSGSCYGAVVAVTNDTREQITAYLGGTKSGKSGAKTGSRLLDDGLCTSVLVFAEEKRLFRASYGVFKRDGEGGWYWICS